MPEKRKRFTLHLWPHRAENPTQGQPLTTRRDDPHRERYRAAEPAAGDTVQAVPAEPVAFRRVQPALPPADADVPALGSWSEMDELRPRRWARSVFRPLPRGRARKRAERAARRRVPKRKARPRAGMRKARKARAKGRQGRKRAAKARRR